MIECCEICTGRHATSACVIGRAHIEACFAANEPEEFIAPVIPLPMFKGEERRAIRHYSRTKRDYSGIRVTRLA